MTTIRATCGACGDVELTTADVQVMISEETGEGTYSFRCPHCQDVVVKGSPRHTIDLLVSAGVRYSTWGTPAESPLDPTAPAFDYDDLLAFHAFLTDDAAVAGALDSLPH
ncbi:hypothetical protein [Actinomarinicola tropica]|uniref:Uncharacterized protein n=1 Tax=Actinomarinicola tropica TaxID=2789776 RepID=A0A5Q2RNY5_9ACTN|nr:hypothetical protein [Actinomarinicola tropica]QGG96301.1 hypothetical protein GH723_15015 [Actinomarinicola tropica]